MTEKESKSMMILADTLIGEINRMCVTGELTEFNSMFQHARINLIKLYNMIYDVRFRVESEGLYEP